MRSRLIRTLGFLAFCVPVVAAASPASNLKRMLSGIDSLEGRFDQMVLDGGGTRLQQSAGLMQLKRPGLFRWRTEEPFPQLLVADGVKLWLYDEDLEQVTQKALDERLEQTPALLLSGDLDKLEAAFRIEGPAKGNQGVYRLTPIDSQALFTVMSILFEDGLPQEIQLEDNLGQRTSIAFTALTINPSLADELFQFKVPEGVDLIIE